MEKVARDNPADMEAKIFYALAANQTALTTDKKYTQQLKAAAILEPLFREHPTHPGLAHYIIHAYDHPPLAEKALGAARRYASLASGSAARAPHAVAHVHAGWVVEGIDRNQSSIGRSGTEGECRRGKSCTRWIIRRTRICRSRRDADARRLTDRAARTPRRRTPRGAAAPGVAGVYATAAIPARYALEREAWGDAASLTVRQSASFHIPTRSRISRAPSAQRVRQSRRPPRQISNGSRCCVTR